MSDEVTPESVGLIIGACMIMALFPLPMVKSELKKTWNRWFTAWLVGCLTAWLWMPWVCLGIYSLSNINTSLAAYVRRPDQVTPVPPRTYRADETPTVEKP